MTEVSANAVLEGLFEWMKSNPWFMKDKLEGADLTMEQAAQEAVLMLARNDFTTYRNLPPGVRCLVVHLTMDFIAKLMGPMSRKTWSVSGPPGGKCTVSELAWLAIEQEVLRSSVPGSAPH